MADSTDTNKPSDTTIVTPASGTTTTSSTPWRLNDNTGSTDSTYYDPKWGTTKTNQVPIEGEQTNASLSQKAQQLQLGSNKDKATKTNEYNQLSGFNASYIENNILDKYDSYTYHWRMFLVHPTELTYLGENPKEYKKRIVELEKEGKLVTIVESGATGYGIDEVRIKSVLGGKEARNTHLVAIRMDVTEPLGTTLIEKMALSAAKLKIPDFKTMVYMLELSFLAHDPHTGRPILVPNTHKVWSVSILDIQTHMDEIGTKYTLTMAQKNDLAKAVDTARLKKPISITASTVGEVFKKLAEQMRPDPSESLDFFVLDHHYDFKFIGEPNDNIEDWSLVDPSDQMVKPQQSKGWVTKDAKGTQIHFAEGTSIYDIVDVVFACTKEAQEKLGIKNNAIPNVAQQTQAQVTDSNKSADRTVTDVKQNTFQFAKVIPDVQLREYDPYAGDYHKNITYYVHLCDTSSVRLDPAQAAALNEPQAALRRFYEFGRRLARRYDYLFTGTNTSILNMDIKMDHLYKTTMSMMGGIYTSALVTDGYMLDDNKAGVRIAALRKRFDSNVRQLKDIDGQLAQIGNATDTVSVKKRDDLLRQKNTIQQQNTLIRNDANAIRANPDVTQFDTEREAQKEYGGIKKPMSEQEQKFIESQKKRIDDFWKKNNKVTYAENIQGDLQVAMDWFSIAQRPTAAVRFGEDDRSTEADFYVSIETRYDRGRHLMGAVLNQIYTRDADFINVNLEVRGDPYWLGLDPFEQLAYQKYTVERGYRDKTSGTTPNPDAQAHTVEGYPNYIEADHMFLLTFNSPKDADPNTGITEYSGPSLFEGIYNVLQIDNIFRQGLFTQTLMGAKDPFTAKTLLKRIKERDKVLPNAKGVATTKQNAAAPENKKVEVTDTKTDLPAPAKQDDVSWAGPVLVSDYGVKGV